MIICEGDVPSKIANMGIVGKRNSERRLLATSVNYTYKNTDHNLSDPITSVGISTDLSTRGLGLYTSAPLQVLQEVTLFNEVLFPKPVYAETRWCSRVSENIYKAGLMFRTDQAGPLEVLTDGDSRRTPIEDTGIVTEARGHVFKETKPDIASLRKTFSTGVQKLLRENKRLRALTVTDELTGIHNRRYFFERLDAEWNLLNRYGHSLSLMLLDIDDFKNINDRFGHVTGDAFLKEFACVINNTLRRGDIFARYGGEEFVVILPHTDGRAALRAAEHIRRAVESTDFVSIGEANSITVSIGVAEVGEELRDSLEALRRADRALYQAKKRGKNVALLWLKK